MEGGFMIQVLLFIKFIFEIKMAEELKTKFFCAALQSNAY